MDFVRTMKQSRANDVMTEKELGEEWMRGNRLNLNSHIPNHQWNQIVQKQKMYRDQVAKTLDKIVSTIDDA